MESSKLSSASSWQGTVLSKDNLKTYTDWLIELRDYVYSHGSPCGELMEHHLVGEPCEIPVVAGGRQLTKLSRPFLVTVLNGRHPSLPLHLHQ